MSNLMLALSALLLVLMVVIMAPNIFALNRQHALRNVAIWLAVMVGLGLIYLNLGPGSAHPILTLPGSMTRDTLARLPPAENATPETALPAATPTEADKPGQSNAPASDKDFTPPKEE